VQRVNFNAMWQGADHSYEHQDVFTARTFQSVRTLLNDVEHVGSELVEDILGPSSGRTLLELDPPVHTAERPLVAMAFRPSVLSQ
jgi:cytochrome P450